MKNKTNQLYTEDMTAAINVLDKTHLPATIISNIFDLNQKQTQNLTKRKVGSLKSINHDKKTRGRNLKVTPRMTKAAMMMTYMNMSTKELADIYNVEYSTLSKRLAKLIVL